LFLVDHGSLLRRVSAILSADACCFKECSVETFSHRRLVSSVSGSFFSGPGLCAGAGYDVSFVLFFKIRIRESKVTRAVVIARVFVGPDCQSGVIQSGLTNPHLSVESPLWCLLHPL